MKNLQIAWLLALAAGLLSVEAYGQNITSISPNPVSVGTGVTITGTGFGTSQGLTGTISFPGVPSSPKVVASSWTSTQIRVTVPLSAVSGTVTVTVSGHVSNSVGLTVTPLVSSLSPLSAVSGGSVTINGSGFGNSPTIGSSSVAFNGLASTPTSWSSTTIVAPVPNGATAGPVVVTVAGQASSGASNFTPTPVIGTLSPASGASGSLITISGSSFGNTQGTSTLTFNGVTAAISSWTNTSIQATVPNNTTTGPIVVAVNGVPSAGANFTVTPGITGLTPNPGLADSSMTISGTNFGTSQGSTSIVTFNGIVGTVTSWTNSSIQATVPSNAIAGPVVVTVGGMASNSVQFSLTSPYRFTLSYAPDGDVLSAQDSVNGNWSYTYDDFNRLVNATNSAPQAGLSYSYDRYGNRWQQNVTAGTSSSSVLTFSGGPASSTATCYHAAGLTNQADGYCYDAAGNLQGDGQHIYVYDAENRIISVDGGQVKYAYDADGQRVEKTSTAGSADYVYDLGGHVIGEINGVGAWTRTEIYASGRHLGTYNNGTIYFIQSDWQGTERERVLLTGDPYEICASLPFGDGLQCVGASDPSPDHFTDKPRDIETGLDYFGARYFSSAMGRWLSPDWGVKPVAVPYADFGEPQSLNLYRYAENNPVSISDPDGHCDTTCQILKGTMVGTGRFLEPFCVPCLAVHSMKQGYADFKDPEGAQVRAKAQLRGLATTTMALSGDHLAQTEMTAAVVDHWQHSDTKERSATVTQGVLTVASLFVGGEFAAGDSLVTVYRVEGLVNTRILIGEAGEVAVIGSDRVLFLNFGSKARAQEFLAVRIQQGMEGAQIKSFKVPKSFLEDLQAAAVDEKYASKNPGRPILVDITKAPNQFGLRQDQIQALQNAILQGSGQTH